MKSGINKFIEIIQFYCRKSAKNTGDLSMNRNKNEAVIKAVKLKKLMNKKSFDQQKQIIVELKDIYENNFEYAVALEYVQSLAILSCSQGNRGDIKEAKKTTEQIKVLYDKYHNKSITKFYIKALSTLSWNQGNCGEVEEVSETIKKIEDIYYKEQNKHSASSYAIALSSLSWSQGNRGNIEEAKKTIVHLKDLCECYQCEDFTRIYAEALIGLSRNQGNCGNITQAKDTIREFKALYSKYEDTEFIRFHVWVLVCLLCNQINHTNIKEAEKTIEEINSIHSTCKYKDPFKYITTSQISDLLAKILFVENSKTFGSPINLLDKIIHTFKPKLDLEGSPTLKKIIEGYEFKDEKGLYTCLIRIYICVAKIKSELTVTNICEGERLGHYTKIYRLNKFLTKNNPQIKCKSNKTNKKNMARLRLSNASYMNDPSEGKALVQYLKKMSRDISIDIKSPDNKDKRDSLGTKSNSYNILDQIEDMYTKKIGASNIYLFSLSKAIDILPMWSIYGENGQGCCLIFDSNIFDIPKDNILGNTIQEEIGFALDKSHQIKERKTLIDINENVDKFHLYRICYIPSKASKKMTDLLRKLEQSINHRQIKQLKEKENSNDILNLINNILDEIRYLFKADTYSYEEEYRLLKLVDVTNKKIKLSEVENSVPFLYIELEKNLKYKEIILGPKVNNPDFIAPYITYIDGSIMIEKSSIKYR